MAGARLQRVVNETVHAAGFAVTGDPHVLVGEPVDANVYSLERVHNLA